MRILAAEGSRAVLAAISRGAGATEISGYPRCKCGGPRVLAHALEVRVHPRVLVCETCKRAVPATEAQLAAATECERAFVQAAAEGRSPVRCAEPPREPRMAPPRAQRSPFHPPTPADLFHNAPIRVGRRRC